MLSWFTSALLPPIATLALAAAVLLALLWRNRSDLRKWWPDPVSLAALGAALLIRLPAIIEPAGFVGSDGSLQAMVAHRIFSLERPAPVFVEGSGYQGTLKAHLGALAGVAVGGGDLGRLVVIGSTLVWLLGVAGTMALGRRLGGTLPGLVAGLFLALSPRFATIFSVNNVGEYPDVIGLGALALAWTAALGATECRGFAARWAYFGIGALIGVAMWQQPIAASFGLAAFGLLGARALAQRDPWFLAAFVGLAFGRAPVLLADVSNVKAVGGFLALAGRTLTPAEHIRGTFGWAFPVTFTGLANDNDWPDAARLSLGFLCAGVVSCLAIGARDEIKSARVTGRFEGVRIMALLQFASCLAFIWLVTGGGQYGRPRYFLPLLPAFALAFADLVQRLSRRARIPGVALAMTLIGWNAVSNVERMRAGLEDGRALRMLARRVQALGLTAGYSDVASAGPMIMLTGERVSVDGVLVTDEGQRLPGRHVERVRRLGADFLLVEKASAADMDERLRALGVSAAQEPFGDLRLFRLSRRVHIAELRDVAPSL